MRRFLFLVLLLAGALTVVARVPETESGRIYTEPDSSSSGGIDGRISKGDISYAIAVDRERKRVYLGDGDGNRFRFTGMAVGKYDLVLITADGNLYEGLELGEPVDKLPPKLLENLKTRIAKADEFFNRSTPHRLGVEGERAFAFVERIRDNRILRGSGKKMDVEMRRLEIIQLQQAADDWQMSDTRHIYREPEPGAGKHRPFLVPRNIPALGNIRVVERVKELGTIMLPLN